VFSSIADISGSDSILCLIAILAHIGINSIKASKGVFSRVEVPLPTRVPGKYLANILNNSGLPLKF